jgi:hypothetical protein
MEKIMKTKPNLDPIALDAAELRSSATFEKRAERHGLRLDTGTGELLREIVWRRLVNDSEKETLRDLFAMHIAGRRVTVSERVALKEEATLEEKENAMLELFGDFPRMRPFSETPPNPVIGEDSNAANDTGPANCVV